MTAPAELLCRRCLDPYREHSPDGPCQAVKGDHEQVPCVCPGFLWVDPAGAVGGYTTPPNPRDYGLSPDWTPDLGDSEG